MSSCAIFEGNKLGPRPIATCANSQNTSSCSLGIDISETGSLESWVEQAEESGWHVFLDEDEGCEENEPCSPSLGKLQENRWRP